jgi:predicted HTH domain antitoxin
MGDVTALRLPKDIEAVIEERVKEEKLDKSSVMKQFLMIGIKEYRKQKAIQLYRDGKISLSQAKEMAGVTVYEMIDLLVKAGVKSNYSIEDMEKEKKLFEKLFKKK